MDKTATCPMCQREHCKVKEDFRMATRTEPRQSLGFSGYCPDCDCSFKVQGQQQSLVAA